MKTVILVGGLGTRLQGVVKDLPKPMADIDGKPFLEYLMFNMLKYGTTGFILCVSYKKEAIMDYFGDNFCSVPVKYSIEEEPLGTGGAIKQAFELFDIDKAIVLNGDSYIKMDYADYYNKMHNEKLALALKYVDNASRYGLVETQGNNIVKYHEKSENAQAGFINAGIYVINKSLFEQYKTDFDVMLNSFQHRNSERPCGPETSSGRRVKFSFEKDIFEKYIQELTPKFYKTEDYFIDIGIPESYAQAQMELREEICGKNKALFVDRDGVINIDKHHLYRIEDCEFIEGIFELCKKAKKQGYKLIVVTNQAGIAKGVYTEEDYHKLMEYICTEFEKQGCKIDGIYFCPYHPDGIGEYKKVSFDRKPNPGMILKAAKDFDIDLSQSILIGDTESDIEAGLNAKIGKTVRFLNEGYIKGERETKANKAVKNLSEFKFKTKEEALC